MRRLLAGGLGLILGLSTSRSYAQDLGLPPHTIASPPVAWPTASTTEQPPLVTLGRPVALPTSKSNPSTQPVSTDPQIVPAGFSQPLLGLPRPLVQAQSSESPQPLPAGPAVNDSPSTEIAQPQDQSKAPAEKLGPARLMPVPEPIGAPKAPGVVAHSVCTPDCSDDCGICGEECTGPTCWGLFRRWDAVPQEPHWLWFRGDYLLWWMKKSPLPPLVTTSLPGTPRELAGVLGVPGTEVLFPGNGNPDRSGGRFTLGFWFNEEQTIGIESTTFFLAERSLTFRAASPGAPILARPFFNVLNGMEASELVAFPGLLGGNVAVVSANQLWGTELNLRTNCWRGCFWHLDWLVGVRFLALDDHLDIAEGLMVPAPGGPLVGSSIMVQDHFGTHNLFVGGQTGLDMGFRWRRWSFDLLGKVALGNTHEELNINGFTQFGVPGLPMSVQPGGLYALPSNIGHYSRDRFSVVPEAGFTVGYQLTRGLRAVVGYTFLYNSSVLRPGNQIDRGLNVSQLPSQIGPGMLVGAARPAPVFRGSDFWAQGISIGLELRY